MQETVIKIENLKKQYKLGSIGGGTLARDLQSWWAKKRGKEDPNALIGTDSSSAQINNQTFWALNGIDLEVHQGEAVGIIGANGAGKSTLLKILSRVTAPTEGEIKIKGRIASMLEVGTGFHGELTGRENIYLNGAILGMSRKEVDEKIEDIIEFSECRAFIDTPVKRYSSGMYVKLAFAVAAHLDAEILVMDEVLAVGDMKFQKKCLGKMDDVAKNQGRSVLYVSHNMNTIRQLCDRCVVLDKGKLIYDGDVEEAIKLYLNMGIEEGKIFYDLRNVKRPYDIHGVLFRVLSFEFLNKETPLYYSNEKIMFKITWSAKSNLRGLRLLFSIRDTEDGRTVGTTQSEPFADTVEGQTGESCFEFDISNLAEAKYFFQIDVYSMNEFGTHSSYDHPSQQIVFEVLKDPQIVSIAWQTKHWGNIRLNSMKVINKQDDM